MFRMLSFDILRTELSLYWFITDTSLYPEPRDKVAWFMHTVNVFVTCRLPPSLTLNLLTTTIVAPASNASKWQMGFNSAIKGLIFRV
jgi:hypothetical protein